MDLGGLPSGAGKNRGEFQEAELQKTVRDRQTSESPEEGQGLRAGEQCEERY